MLGELVQSIKKSMEDTYPQIKIPAAMQAEILSADKSGTRYVREVFLEGSDGGLRKYRMEEDYYVYAVRILDNTGNVLSEYPVIPGIKSRNCYEKGAIVTVVFTGAELYPVIVGG